MRQAIRFRPARTTRGRSMYRAVILSVLYLLAMTTLVSAYAFVA